LISVYAAHWFAPWVAISFIRIRKRIRPIPYDTLDLQANLHLNC
jgi:hypothetical protein